MTQVDGSGDGVHQVPPEIRMRLLHAYLQLVADEHGIDILHLKGAAVHTELQRSPRVSLDVDVLVRPSQVDEFIAILQNRGWSKVTGFTEGSAFGHAMNLHHDLGMLDLHRSWPGFEMDASRAFDKLWKNRVEWTIAEVPCTVPGVLWQRLILLLHYGRSGGQREMDLVASWQDAHERTKAQVRALAREFHATLALAAATGELDDYRSDPSYSLWSHFARGDSGRLDEWWGRWRAARTLTAKSGVLKGFFSVNSDLLRAELGRAPLRKDYVQAYRRRLATARADAKLLVQNAVRRRRSR